MLNKLKEKINTITANHIDLIPTFEVNIPAKQPPIMKENITIAYRAVLMAELLSFLKKAL